MLPVIIAGASSEFSIEQSGRFSYITGDYQHLFREPGYPDLPVIRKTVKGEIVNFAYALQYEETVKLSAPVAPIPYPVSKNTSFSLEDAEIPDYNVYNSDNALLNDYYSIRDMGDYTVLEIYPFDYIPSENILIVRHYSIDYSILPHYAKAASQKMMLIYPSDYSSFIDELDLFFRKRGKEIIPVPRDSIGNTSEEIAQYVRDKHQADPFDFMLILGTINRVPGFIGLGADYPRTDLNYSLIDTLDYFPDIIVTRVPAQDSVEMRSYIDNLYQSMEHGLSDEKNKAFLMATSDAGNHVLVEQTHNYTMNILRSGGFFADSLYDYYGSGTEISNAVNDGREILIYSGHGSTGSWQGPAFNADSIDGLENNPYFPFIFSFACLTGKYDFNDFLGRFWTMNEKKGAVGFIGSSVNTYWLEDDCLQRALADSILNTDYLGNMMNGAKMNFFANYGDSTADGAGTRTRAYFECYNYFTIPDIAVGNRDMHDINFACDRFEPASSGIIPFDFEFTGTLDMPSYVMLYDASVSNTDTLSIYSAGTYGLSHSLSSGNELYLSLYIPGERMITDTVTLIADGPYAALTKYEVSDIRVDTFFFDLSVKNYGNIISDSISAFISYLSANFNLVSCEGVSGPLMSESTAVMNDGLVLKLAEVVTDSLSLCSLGFASGTDTTYAGISLNSLNPDFAVNFEYAVCNEDTSGQVTVGGRSQMYFMISNTSLLNMRELRVNVHSDEISFIDSIVDISALPPADSVIVSFPAYLSSTDKSAAAVTVDVSLGSMTKAYTLSIPLKLENSALFYGPVNGYYIYTSDMIDLVNAPQLYDYTQYNTGWKTQYFRNDTLMRIELPFYFRMGGIFTDKLFLNSNGILAVQPDSVRYGSPASLPAEAIHSSAFICAWEDYIQSNNYGTTLEDQPGNILTRFDESNYRFIILYNKVKNIFSEEYSFAIAVDTSSVEVYFYDIPDSNYLVNGIQFSDAQYLALTGDSFFDSRGLPVLRDSLAVRFSDELPVFTDKYTAKPFTREIDPILMNGPVFRTGEEIYLGIFRNGDYDIDLYDASGRMVSRLHSGFTGKGIINAQLNVKSGGVYFLHVREDGRKIMSEKLILFR